MEDAQRRTEAADLLRAGIAAAKAGRRYAKDGLWALAVIHLQRAAGAMSNQLEPQLMLAWAYMELKRYERAEQALAEARRINPDDMRLAELVTDLEKAREGIAR